jgi:chromate reductase
MPKILVFVGSLRAESGSKAVAKSLVAALSEQADFRFADIGSVPLYNADLTDEPSVVKLIEDIRASDGLLFVTPEYNYSVPGVLKNAIDWASRPSYQSVFVGKPCAVVSTSAGVLGGVRAQGHLKIILNAMLAKLHVCQEMAVPMINDRTSNSVFDHQPTLDFVVPKVSAFISDCTN